MKLKKCAGFTLVEVLIVMSLIAVVGFWAAINSVRSAAGYQLQAAGENLLQALREARTEAVARNTSVDLLITGTGQGCLIRQLDPSTNVVIDTLSIRPINLADAGAGINIAFTSGFANGETHVVFNNRGRITSLASGATSATLTVTSSIVAGQAITVTLWPQTGFISRP